MAIANSLRNDSYYMATNETWSPMVVNGNSSVLIEEDVEPLSQYVTDPLHSFHISLIPIHIADSSR